MDRRRRGNRPYLTAPTPAVVRQVGNCKRGRQLSAPAESDAGARCTGALWRDQTPPNGPSTKGFRPPGAPYNARIPGFAPFGYLHAVQQVAASNRPFKVGSQKLPIPGRPNRSNPRQFVISRILAQSRNLGLRI